MKSKKLYIVLLAAILGSLAFKLEEPVVFPDHLKNTNIAKLKEVDSLVYFQCHSESVRAQSIMTEGGQKIDMNSKNQYITITEKFKLFKNGAQYRLQYFTSPATWYPNKKFAYLKLTEKPYWEFKLHTDTILPKEDVLRLAAYETKLRALTEYDFKVMQDNSPQLIINGKKISEQFGVTEKILIAGSLSVLKSGKK